MTTLNKTDLAGIVAQEMNITKKDALAVTETVFSAIVNALANGDEVSIAKFGKFTVKEVAECTRRNPQDGSEVLVPKHNAAKFKFSSVVKDAVK